MVCDNVAEKKQLLLNIREKLSRELDCQIKINPYAEKTHFILKDILVIDNELKRFESDN